MNACVNDRTSHRLCIGNEIDDGVTIIVTNYDCGEPIEAGVVPDGALLIQHSDGLRPVNKVTVMLHVKKAGWRQTWRRARVLFWLPVRAALSRLFTSPDAPSQSVKE